MDTSLTSSTRTRPDVALVAAGALVVALALFRLTDYPLTWYDEGSHLHVPKTLVTEGAYADRSSEGFRYYGPTLGVGPTVLLPVAGVFKVAGIGLLQARLVMAGYLLAAVALVWHLAGMMGGRRLAWAATALFVTSRGIGTIEFGRQVLGEVPALAFLAAGLVLWFSAWERASWKRLAVVGLLLGLSVVTKPQFFVVLAPTLALAWIANLVYYRATPQRVFVVPGVLLGACFAAWQVYVVMFLGPGDAAENLALYRAATASAATVFSPALMKRSLTELSSLKVYFGWLLPALIYGLFLALPRRRDGQQWGVLLILIAVNLTWYVVASVSWIRYAFPALALSSLLVARLFHDLTGGFAVGRGTWRRLTQLTGTERLRLTLIAVLVAMVLVPLAQTTRALAVPATNAPVAMASYLDRQIPREALIETWEPEMGFLTDHRYHYPPQAALYQAVSHIWMDAPSPADSYRFIEDERPEYVLVGQFARWVGMYSIERLAESYLLVHEQDGYQLFRRSSR